jgi:hypothetical protein
LFVSIKRGANPTCELVIYPKASHKFTTEGRPSQRLDALRRIAQWLTRWTTLPRRVEAGHDHAKPWDADAVTCHAGEAPSGVESMTLTKVRGTPA